MERNGSNRSLERTSSTSSTSFPCVPRQHKRRRTVCPRAARPWPVCIGVSCSLFYCQQELQTAHKHAPGHTSACAPPGSDATLQLASHAKPAEPVAGAYRALHCAQGASRDILQANSALRHEVESLQQQLAAISARPVAWVHPCIQQISYACICWHQRDAHLLPGSSLPTEDCCSSMLTCTGQSSSVQSAYKTVVCMHQTITSASCSAAKVLAAGPF